MKRLDFETAYLIAVIDTSSKVVVEVFVASAPAEGLTMRRGQHFATMTTHTARDFHHAREELLHSVKSAPYYKWAVPLLPLRDR